MIECIEKAITDLRQRKPLVLNLTNYVTMDFMANSLLALGAAPIMTVCDDEFEELTAIAAAININIGTLDETFIKQSITIAQVASHLHKPIILDPVGAGASRIRTRTARSLVPYASIIRGNASEIIALAADTNNTKGVESTNTTDEAKTVAINLANTHHCTVFISGPIDFITDGTRQIEVPYGSHLMPLITGMGCVLTAVVAAFRGVIEDSFIASNIAAHYFALCGELAGFSNPSLGSYKTRFIDNLYAANFLNMRQAYAKQG